MSGLFYIAFIFLLTLIVTVLGGYQFHEVAGVAALGLSSLAMVISIVNAADLNSLFKVLGDNLKETKEVDDERSGT